MSECDCSSCKEMRRVVAGVRADLRAEVERWEAESEWHRTKWGHEITRRENETAVLTAALNQTTEALVELADLWEANQSHGTTSWPRGRDALANARAALAAAKEVGCE